MTKEALQKSIQHWKDNVAAETPKQASVGPEACALCALYRTQRNCMGCIVAAQAGASYCRYTPYAAAERAYNSWQYAYAVRTGEVDFREAWRQAATRQLKFLEALQ